MADKGEKDTVMITDPEIIAMAMIVDVLEPLGENERKRVTEWAYDRWGDD